MALPSTASLPQSGNIVSRWTMNGDLLDSVGSNDLTNNGGATFTSNLFDSQAVDLESTSSQYLSIADASQTGLDFTSDFTIAKIIKLESLPSSGSAFMFFSKWGTASNNSFYLDLFNSSGTYTWRFQTSSNGTANTLVSATTTGVASGTDYHFICVYDASAGSFTIYLDGVQDATQTGLNTSIHSGTSPFVLGAFGAGSGGKYDGLMQDVMAYNYALSSGEASDHYDAYYATGGAGQMTLKSKYW